LDLVQAFRFNPLVAAGCLAFAGWFVLWLVDACGRKRRAMHSWNWICNCVPPWAVIGAVLANWVYLVIALPM
jgi:hypothetical protein